MSGLLAGVIIGFFTEYFTSDHYKPTRKLADTSTTGPATIMIGGLSLGMLSTAIPVITVGVSVLISFYVSGGGASFNAGLYGVGLSAVGMLSTLGITLATDAYGPVADNAGGIAEMSHMDPEVRKRTDALDSLGNTTAATGKGFAIGSAALTALALIAAYIDEIHILDPDFVFDITITNPPVLVGLFIGAMLPFLFSSFTMNAVGRAAQSIVMEVRRQFKEIKGLMEGKAEPDYARCVDICTRSAQKEMIKPTILAISAPHHHRYLPRCERRGRYAGRGNRDRIYPRDHDGQRGRRPGTTPRSTSRQGISAARTPPPTMRLWWETPSGIPSRTPPVPPSISSSNCFPWYPSFSPRLSWPYH